MKMLTNAALIVALAGLAVACGQAETSGDGEDKAAPATAPATAPAPAGATPVDSAPAADTSASTELRIAVEGMT